LVAEKKMEKVVPERPYFATLLNRIVPPYFFTMPSDTHDITTVEPEGQSCNLLSASAVWLVLPCSDDIALLPSDS
jgi:hypothetical protein